MEGHPQVESQGQEGWNSVAAPEGPALCLDSAEKHQSLYLFVLSPICQSYRDGGKALLVKGNLYLVGNWLCLPVLAWSLRLTLLSPWVVAGWQHLSGVQIPSYSASLKADQVVEGGTCSEINPCRFETLFLSLG